MKMPFKFKKERFKTIVIVVLFIMTILLLYFLWEDSLSKSIRFPIDMLTRSGEAPAPEIGEIVKPARLVVNFGGDTYAVTSIAENERWQAFVAELGAFSGGGPITVREITKSQFDEALKIRSVRAEFNYWLPLSETMAYFNMTGNAEYTKVEAFSTIAYSRAIPESLLIYDGKNKRYYRLIADTDRTGLGGLIDSMEQDRRNTYFPMGTFLGIENSSLMPIALQSDMRQIEYSIELAPHEDDKIVDYAKKFYGEGFDFVRKITESSGTIVYMYGYGEKNLIIDPSGKIEFTEEPDNAGAPAKFYEALDMALSFIESHGGWASLDGSELTPYLRRVSELNSAQGKGYEFVFGMLVNGQPLYYTDDDKILSVSVIGRSVTAYHRKMTHIEMDTLRGLEGRPMRDTLDPINILTEQYKFIRDVLAKNGIQVTGADDTELFENTAAQIDRIETGYIRVGDLSGDEPLELEPAWIFRAGKISVYFNIYTGDVIGTAGSPAGGM